MNYIFQFALIGVMYGASTNLGYSNETLVFTMVLLATFYYIQIVYVIIGMSISGLGIEKDIIIDGIISLLIWSMAIQIIFSNDYWYFGFYLLPWIFQNGIAFIISLLLYLGIIGFDEDVD